MFVRKWQASGDTKGKVIIAHGLGEHSGRYEDLAQFLSRNGFVVYATDNTGHGLDSAPYGAAKSISEYVERIKMLADMANFEIPDNNLFLFGHSLGGLTSIRLLEKYPSLFRAAILSSPPLMSYRNELKSLYFILFSLSFIVPFLRFSNRIDPSEISKDDKTNRFYKMEPSVHDKISVRFFFDMEKQISLSWERVDSINCPVMLTYGSEDRVVSTEAIEDFYNKLKTEKKIRCFEGSKHEPFRDQDVKEIYHSEILDFLLSLI
ncbi:hypothetical protein AT15_01475 [Kosmotoga arenicorallina S304]|uniref:Serine aminopeptidase S33 domain-containing protein n=1 Tax=Kosmotoga arenicorallina S304 TaxID=1453497 RepID=A0A176K009_9BACT|nr:alpha/beta hydrolase [Kosmotoga arenicorallina]OAA29736.1 hypothetical protein AT15_01475 [Kosmotoga arenicorallina S304]